MSTLEQAVANLNKYSIEAVLEAVRIDLWKNTAIVTIDDATGNILNATLEAEKMFGYGRSGELVGQPVEVLLPESKRSGHVELRKTYYKNPIRRQMGARDSVLQGQKRDGTLFPVEITINSLAPAAGCRISYAVIVDMSARAPLAAMPVMPGKCPVHHG